MSESIKFWLAKELVGIGMFFGVVLLIALWFGFLYGMSVFSDWRLRRLHDRRKS